MKNIFVSIVLLLWSSHAHTQSHQGADFPVRGFCIAAPRPQELTKFIQFVNEELATRQVNTLILRVDYNYQYATHPELRDSIALSKNDIKKLTEACKKNKM